MNNIKLLRSEKGMTQKQFADKLGIAQNTLSNWENGVREPDFDSLKRMASIFEVGVDFLLGRSTVRDPSQGLEDVYFNFAKDAQDDGIDPEDIRAALEMIKKLRSK